jgi:hypothetical protein
MQQLNLTDVVINCDVKGLKEEREHAQCRSMYETTSGVSSHQREWRFDDIGTERAK